MLAANAARNKLAVVAYVMETVYQYTAYTLHWRPKWATDCQWATPTHDLQGGQYHQLSQA